MPNHYTYCHNNPILGIDPTGHFLDTLFDVVSLAVDVVSFAMNPTPMGAVDILCDVVGLVTPGLPSAGLKAGVKAVGAAADAIKAADKVNDVKKAVEVADDVHDAAKAVDNITDAGKALDNTTDALKQGK